MTNFTKNPNKINSNKVIRILRFHNESYRRTDFYMINYKRNGCRIFNDTEM